MSETRLVQDMYNFISWLKEDKGLGQDAFFVEDEDFHDFYMEYLEQMNEEGEYEGRLGLLM